jgi:hypothetical protein
MSSTAKLWCLRRTLAKIYVLVFGELPAEPVRKWKQAGLKNKGQRLLCKQIRHLELAGAAARISYSCIKSSSDSQTPDHVRTDS